MLVAVVIGDGGGYSFKSGVVGWKLIRSLAKLPTEHPHKRQATTMMRNTRRKKERRKEGSERGVSKKSERG
jgi:hypothetical protein